MKRLVVTLLVCLAALPVVATPIHHKKRGPSHAPPKPLVLDFSTAVLLGRIPAVEAALRRGAAIDKQDATGETALITATEDCRLGVVKLLLAHKASVNTEDFNGLTALDFTNPDMTPGLSAKERPALAQIAALLIAAGAVKGDGNQSIMSADHRLIGHVSSFNADPDDDQIHYLEGTVTNRSQSTISYVEIDANFMAGDTTLDSGLTNMQNLGPGDSWDFKITTFGNAASSYSLTKLTGN